MVTELDEFQRRVLGALIEKSLAQPDYYPMTLNALVAACNQKSNRNPVMSLDEGTVLEAVEALRERDLAALVLPATGSRTNRYKHTADTHFGWQRRELAVMAELLLRGPQTPGELRTRCARMAPIDNMEAINIVLDVLQKAEPPMVAVMPREPGQSAVRYSHRLYPASERPAAGTGDSAAASHAASPPGPRQSVHAAMAAAVPTPDAQQSGALNERIEALQSEIGDLQESLAELRSRLDQLESQLLH